MANIKSQKKRIITNEKARTRNVAVRSRMRTIVKQAREALEGKDAGAIGEAVKAAVSEIDRAASKGILPRNSAARKKSELQRLASASTRG
nr:SSU ribosomal protein S20p [uncultured bacterium]